MSTDKAVFFAGTFFAVRDGRIEASPVSDSPRETFTPDEFRERLATLGRLADEAGSEPDPAEVRELAELISAEMARHGDTRYELYPTAARVALQWIRERKARS